MAVAVVIVGAEAGATESVAETVVIFGAIAAVAVEAVRVEVVAVAAGGIGLLEPIRAV